MPLMVRYWPGLILFKPLIAFGVSSCRLPYWGSLMNWTAFELGCERLEP